MSPLVVLVVFPSVIFLSMLGRCALDESLGKTKTVVRRHQQLEVR